MSLAVDQKYIMLLSGSVRNFKRVDKEKWSLSCPLCGDSAKSKHKARGNFFIYNGRYNFHCFNCEESRSVKSFLEEVAPNLYSDYMRDSLAEFYLDKEDYVRTPKKIEFKESPLDKLMKISELSDEHEAYQYLVNRKIPSEFLDKIYYAPRFAEWVNSIEPRKLLEEKEHPRIIIPLMAKDNVFHGFQGRSLGKEIPKYITILTDETYPKIYGLDRVSYFKDIIAVEGPIDSMFLDNSVATCGGDISSALASFPKDKVIVCYDNEKFNKHTIQKLDKAIDLGYRVIIWPERLNSKDINQMIIDGLTKEEIHNMIYQNSYKGMTAKIKLAGWKRC